MRGLADSHVHLHAYDDGAVAAMLRRAEAVGVETIVAVAVDLPSAERTVALARDWRGRPRVLAAVGLHPAHLTDQPNAAVWAGLARLAEDPTVAAIGECGVDAEDGSAAAAVQIAVLERHAELAAALGRPLMLHLRGPALIDPALAALAGALRPGGPGGVVHYFVGDQALAERYLAAGLRLSVGKPATRAENARLRAAIASVPLERLLLETDTYPLPGRSTEPADVRLVAEAVAALHGVDAAAVAARTGQNLAALLGRPG